MNSNKKIVVLGAGIAGTSTAIGLKKLGFDEECLGYYTITNKGLLYPYNMYKYIYRKNPQ